MHSTQFILSSTFNSQFSWNCLEVHKGSIQWIHLFLEHKKGKMPLRPPLRLRLRSPGRLRRCRTDHACSAAMPLPRSCPGAATLPGSASSPICHHLCLAGVNPPPLMKRSRGPQIWWPTTWIRGLVSRICPHLGRGMRPTRRWFRPVPMLSA